MNHRPLPVFAAVLCLFGAASRADAQDNVRGSAEPVVASIAPAKLAYDFLVDGDLAQDDAANRKYTDRNLLFDAPRKVAS